MSQKTLDLASGNNGGAVRISPDPKRARNIHISIANPTNATHVALFGRSRRELVQPPVTGFADNVFPALPITVPNQPVSGVAYTTALLQLWTGELWAAADIANLITIEVMDAAEIET